MKNDIKILRTLARDYAASKLDKHVLRQEIKRILDACARNGCSCDITLKDISTCRNRPENLIEWEQTVMEMVLNH